MPKDQERLGWSNGAVGYGNRNYGATERDLWSGMGMINQGPGKMPASGVPSLAGMFAKETGQSATVRPKGLPQKSMYSKMYRDDAGDAAALASFEGKQLLNGQYAGGAPVGPGPLAGLLNEAVDPVPEERLALTISDFYKPKPKRALAYAQKRTPKVVGGQASGPSQSSDSGRGSAWGVSGSRPTGGGAGGERTGERAFYGR